MTNGNETIIETQISDVQLDFQVPNDATVNVLPIENVVNIEGNVYNPGLITYTNRKSVKQYIELAGGMKKDSIVNDIYIKRSNGRIKNISRLNKLYVSVKAGDTIIVPVNLNPKTFNPTQLTADIVAILTNLVTIIFIIDSNSD